MYTIRNSPKKKRKRYHYNFKGKSKIPFETRKEASDFLKEKHLVNYIIYLCTYCNKYHISHYL
jgi:hypothetical protein